MPNRTKVAVVVPRSVFGALAMGALVACSSSSGDDTPGADVGIVLHDTASSDDTATSVDGADAKGSDTASATDTTPATDTASPKDTSPPTDTGPSGAPTADQLLALVATCDVASKAKYKTDDEAALPSNIDICKLPGAFFWKADMDIDCDGKTSTACNASTDPAFQNETSTTDSKGGWLDAASLPYVVVPLPSTRFDYGASGIQLGAVVAVIYGGKVSYGVFGDEGPSNIIGEASYAMAKSLGIDPNPATGGTDSGVTYIVFTGKSAVVAPIEDHSVAVTLGQSLAAKLVAGK